MADGIADRAPYDVGLKAQRAKGGAEFSTRKGLRTSFGNRTVPTGRCTGCGLLESYGN